MIINDIVYGQMEVTEPVILELINSKAIQRMKKIDQIGYPKHYFKTTYSRYEHSVGVFLLLKKYGASVEEQISGLIHDASHSAFSHCIDYALNSDRGDKQDHQDNVFEEYVRQTDIPEILNKHSIDLEYILDDSHFPLKERDLPDLCADRIDYSLRHAVIFDELKSAKSILDSLVVRDGVWLFKDFDYAKEYAELFSRLNSIYFADITSAIMFRTVGDYIKEALVKKYISPEDLYTTDSEVLEKIEQHLATDSNLQRLFDRLNRKIGCVNDPNNFEAEVVCKSRVVDPLFINEEKIVRVSEVDAQWKQRFQQESKPKKYYLKFEK